MRTAICNSMVDSIMQSLPIYGHALSLETKFGCQVPNAKCDVIVGNSYKHNDN